MLEEYNKLLTILIGLQFTLKFHDHKLHFKCGELSQTYTCFTKKIELAFSIDFVKTRQMPV